MCHYQSACWISNVRYLHLLSALSKLCCLVTHYNFCAFVISNSMAKSQHGMAARCLGSMTNLTSQSFFVTATSVGSSFSVCFVPSWDASTFPPFQFLIFHEEKNTTDHVMGNVPKKFLRVALQLGRVSKEFVRSCRVLVFDPITQAHILMLCCIVVSLSMLLTEMSLISIVVVKVSIRMTGPMVLPVPQISYAPLCPQRCPKP